MDHLREKGLLRLTALIALLPLVLLACAAASGRSEAGAQRIGRYGVTAAVPAGWHQVPLRGLPGAKVPLEVASFEPIGAVWNICSPSPIVSQIPAGGALVQILEDRPAGKPASPEQIKEFPRLARPFHLGPLRAQECGESYPGVPFRLGARGFGLRIWTAPGGPSGEVRRQIEAMMDSLRVRGS